MSGAPSWRAGAGPSLRRTAQLASWVGRGSWTQLLILGALLHHSPQPCLPLVVSGHLGSRGPNACHGPGHLLATPFILHGVLWGKVPESSGCTIRAWKKVQDASASSTGLGVEVCGLSRDPLRSEGKGGGFLLCHWQDFLHNGPAWEKKGASWDPLPEGPIPLQGPLIPCSPQSLLAPAGSRWSSCSHNPCPPAGPCQGALLI